MDQPTRAIRLIDLSDVNVSGIVNDQVLKWDAPNQEYINANASSIVLLALDDLTDVAVSAETESQLLAYDLPNMTWKNVNNISNIISDDATCKIVSNSDASKFARIDITDIATAQTLKVKLPYNATTSMTVVGESDSQLLINKTLTDATNDINARALFSNNGLNFVSTYASTNPAIDQILVATGASTATWQNNPALSVISYGSILTDGASSAQILNVTPGTYDKITKFTTNGGVNTPLTITENALNNKITVLAGNSGTYQIDFTLSASSGTANAVYTIAVYVGGVRCIGSGTSRYKAGLTDVESTGSGCCLANIGASATDIELYATSSITSSVFVPSHLGLTIVKISN